jgi:hypothetical protein
MVELNGKLVASCYLPGLGVGSMDGFVDQVPHGKVFLPQCGDNRCGPEESSCAVVGCILLIMKVLVL